MQSKLGLPNNPSISLFLVGLQQRDKRCLVILGKTLIIVFVFLRVFDDTDSISYMPAIRLFP